MQNFDSLFCFEMHSSAFGYLALKNFSEMKNAKILDASPMGPKHFILLGQANEIEIQEAVSRVKQECAGTWSMEIMDQLILKDPHPALLESVFSLVEQNLEESLVVVETETACAQLVVGQNLIKNHGLKAIEIKLSRLGYGLGFYTGKIEAAHTAAEDGRGHLREAVRKGRIEVITQPSAKFREFFNLDGRS